MDSFETVAGAEAPAEATAGIENEQVTEVEAVDQVDTGEMGRLPVADWDYQRPERGEVRSGVILSISDQEIFVDVGGKRDGVVPYTDMQRMGAEEVAKLSPGDKVLVYVLRPEDQDGNLVLSLNMARQERAWLRAQELADSGEVWEGQVEGYNKGGLVVPLEDIRGFVPASQIPGFPRGLNQEERIAQLEEMVGMALQLKVIEIDRRKRRLILSATTAMRQWRKQQREQLLDNLREGEVCKGVVSSICSFGAFVDLGGADGLIHLSELSWRRVRHPRELLKVGQEVEAYVLRLDHDKRRIDLSLKRLQPEPWALVGDRYELGQLVEGSVTNVVDFGAFAEIDEGIEGLIHVSELSESQVAHPKEVVKKGDLLLLRIIRIDTRRKRLGLSLKRVLEAEWAEWAARLAEAEAAQPVVKEASGPAAESPEALVEEASDPAAESPEVRVEEASDPAAGGLQVPVEEASDPAADGLHVPVEEHDEDSAAVAVADVREGEVGDPESESTDLTAGADEETQEPSAPGPESIEPDLS